MTATIGILLATFNGARFLPAQLRSIAAQTHTDWHLTVRDDASDDDTPAILAAFARAHRGKVTIVKDHHGRLGALGDFNRLLQLAREPYLAFADQDDVWRPRKLERALTRIRALEATQPEGRACLVHADRSIVNAAGDEVAPSYWRSRGIKPSDFGTLESHLGFCVAAGSAMLINRSLADLSAPIPDAARMYDCWIELVANGLGAVAWVDEIALDHRRHGANASGAAADNSSRAARRPLARAARLLKNLGAQREVYGIYFDQAEAFRIRHGAEISSEALVQVDLFRSLRKRALPSRLWATWSCAARPPGFMRASVFAILSGFAKRPSTSKDSGGALPANEQQAA